MRVLSLTILLSGYQLPFAACVSVHEDSVGERVSDAVVVDMVDDAAIEPGPLGGRWIVGGRRVDNVPHLMEALAERTLGNRERVVQLRAGPAASAGEVLRLFGILGRQYLRVRLPGQWEVHPYQVGFVDCGSMDMVQEVLVTGFSSWPHSVGEYDAKKHLAIVLEQDGRLLLEREVVAIDVSATRITDISSSLLRALAACSKPPGGVDTRRVAVVADTRVSWAGLYLVVRALASIGVASFDFGVVADRAVLQPQLARTIGKYRRVR